jgi:putative membrane protein
MSLSDLPALNASLNALSTVLLAAGFVFIKAGHLVAHRNCMVGAFCTSAIFLIGYVANRVIARSVHTQFGGEGAIATIYYVMLLTHVILAIVMVPMIFMTLARARRGDFEAHKRIARWTWPIWMYVSVTGVLVYFFLYRWWPSAH